MTSAEHGRSDSAGTLVDRGDGRTFPCGSCGADLVFSIGQQSLECPYCGDVREIEHAPESEVREQDFRAQLRRLAELRSDAAAGASEDGLNEVQCDACGATVVFPGTLTSSECSFCGSPIQRAAVHTAADRVTVDGVVAFMVNRDTARANLAKWVKSRWFAPNEFKRRGVDGRFTGIYLPFWTFDSHTFSRYRGERGEYYYVTVGSGKNKRRERRTRWYSASGTVRQFFDDVLVVATNALPRSIIDKLEPWPLHTVQPYTPELLAGSLARTYDVELDDGFGIARGRIDDAIRGLVRRDIGGDTQRIHEVSTTYDPITYKHLLLPVWVMAYRFREKTYRVTVNAATGEVHGERPWSAWKIAAAVVSGLVAVGGVAAAVATQQ